MAVLVVVLVVLLAVIPVIVSTGGNQKAADVWKKDVWDFQAFSQTFLNCDFL